MDLLPAAPAGKASRRSAKPSLPKLALPKLSRAKWIGVGAALVAVAAGAFYFTRGGDDTADAGTVPVHVAAALPAKSGAVLTAKQVTAVLPAASVLGAGWVVDPSKTVNAVAGLDSTSATATNPAVCGKLLDSIGPGPSTGKSLASAGRSYTSPTTHAYVGVAAMTYKAVVPATSFTNARKLLPGCKSFTIAGVAKASITAVTFPALGQGALYVGMTAPFIGTTTIPFDTLMVRQGHNVVLVEMISKTPNPAAMTAIAKAALARLPH